MNVRRHLAYGRYVLRHKWFVLRACWMVGASLRLGLLHDLSKLLPSEWMPYAECFYKADGSKQHVESEAFTRAWCRHQKRNLHHWQAWLVTMDNGTTIALRMPHKYMLEMVADWIGAGLAIAGTMEVRQWYARNRDKMLLHPETRKEVEAVLRTLA